MALNLKNLSTRSISAVFFVIILVSCIRLNYIAFISLFFVVAMLALHEYYRLAEKLNAQPYKITGFLFSVVLFVYFSIENLGVYFSVNPYLFKAILLALLVLFPSVLLVGALFSKNPSALFNAQHTLLGSLYVVFPLSLLVTLPVSFVNDIFTYNYFKVLGIIFLIWSNDTLAYLGGSLFGKNKMYERISPGKTWEGTITGALGAIAVGFVLNLEHTYVQKMIWPCIALLVAVFGTIGDLVESMLKRMAGVKDSGMIMPGHGGALDRFDSLIFVSPFIYAFLKVLEEF